MSRDRDAKGTAENVDMGAIDPATPFGRNVDEYRIIDCYCVDCESEGRVFADPGRTQEWMHSQLHPRHTVDYHRVDQEADQ